MMKKHLWLAILCAVVQMAGNAAFAATHNNSPSWEVMGGSSAGLNLSNANNVNTTTISVSGTVGYFFAPQWEVIGNPFLNIASSGTTTTTFNLNVGAEYN